MAVLSIVMVMIGEIFASSARLNRKANDNYNAQSDAQNLMTLIQNEVRYANSVTITGGDPVSFGAGKRYIYAEDGVVMKNMGASPDDARNMIAGTKDFTYGIEFKKSSPKSLSVEIAVNAAGKELYTMQTDIYINNLILSSVSGESGKTVEYTIPAGEPR